MSSIRRRLMSTKRQPSTTPSAIRRILEAPERWRVLEEDVRRCLTRVFSYGVLYTIEPEFILIVAVMASRSRAGLLGSVGTSCKTGERKTCRRAILAGVRNFQPRLRDRHPRVLTHRCSRRGLLQRAAWRNLISFRSVSRS